MAEACGKSSEAGMRIGVGEILLTDVFQITGVDKSGLLGFQLRQSSGIPIGGVHVISQSDVGLAHGNGTRSDTQFEEIGCGGSGVPGVSRACGGEEKD